MEFNPDSRRLSGTIEMRNIIMGSIGVLLGGAMIVSTLVRGLPKADSAYGAGALCASITGFLMFGAGLYALIQGIRSQQEDDEEQPRTRRRKLRRRDRENY